MLKLSTREAAKRLGISCEALSHYVTVGKVFRPEIVTVGRRVVHIWTEKQVEELRQLLPKIANGRKTRYAKLRKKQKAQPKKTVPRKTKKKKSNVS